ncbi:hypothetical protein P3T76_010104 [Phytophthora citrophthora]|uniref:Uncharacterized protein n=1 Tax=Phytophthora citrophthora TaxID=4793 RepID=A0AAD9LIJ1_9STRA|nr:hypothetical protein P3T76_010104 [Phytophthora citrophthora]
MAYAFYHVDLTKHTSSLVGSFSPLSYEARCRGRHYSKRSHYLHLHVVHWLQSTFELHSRRVPISAYMLTLLFGQCSGDPTHDEDHNVVFTLKLECQSVENTYTPLCVDHMTVKSYLTNINKINGPISAAS